MRRIIIILLTISFNSCLPHGNGIDVVVKNKTQDSIHSVIVRSLFSELELGDISPKSKAVGFLDMSNEPLADGGYSVIFKTSTGKEVQQGAGYYTNGGAIDRRVTFIIEVDTIRAEFSNFGRSFKGK